MVYVLTVITFILFMSQKNVRSNNVKLSLLVGKFVGSGKNVFPYIVYKVIMTLLDWIAALHFRINILQWY